MSPIKYHFLNMETKLLVLDDKTLCKEVWHAGCTQAIPYFEGEDFHTLIAGGADFTEKEAIELYQELTGVEIGEVRPPEPIDKVPLTGEA